MFNLTNSEPHCFKVQGVIQHFSLNLKEDVPTKIRYSQLYFIDSGMANQNQDYQIDSQ